MGECRRWVQVPPAKSVASTAVVKPEGNPGDGGLMPGEARMEGQYRASRNV